MRGSAPCDASTRRVAFGHVGVDDALDAPGGLDDVDGERLGDVTADRLACSVDVESHPTAGEGLRRHVPEHDVGIGDRRLRAAASVADRSRVRARALGADEQGALADPRDRAAPGADALHVDHRQTDVVAVAPVPVGLDLGTTVAHEREVEAGAAHVDGHEVAHAHRARSEGGAHDTARRAGRQQRHRALRHVVGRHHAAGRLHDQERPAVARGAQLVLEVVDVRRDPRRDVGVDEGRRHALELGAARHDLVRQRHVVDVGELLADDLRGAAFVRGVHEGEEEHHGDRAHAERLEAPDAAAHRVLVELEHHVALVAHALGDGDAGAAPGDGQGSGVRGVPDLLLVDAAHLDLVAVTLGDEQPRGRAVHLDHRVVGRGGAVHDDVEVGAELREGDAEAVGHLTEAVHDAGRLVVERRRRLVEHDVAVGGDADQVRERAPDVDTDAVAAHSPPLIDVRSASVASVSTASVSSSSEPVSTTP